MPFSQRGTVLYQHNKTDTLRVLQAWLPIARLRLLLLLVNGENKATFIWTIFVSYHVRLIKYGLLLLFRANLVIMKICGELCSNVRY